MRRVKAAAGTVTLFIVAGAGPAFAGISSSGAPGPLVGAGIPALLGLAYVYHRLQRKRDK